MKCDSVIPLYLSVFFCIFFYSNTLSVLRARVRERERKKKRDALGFRSSPTCVNIQNMANIGKLLSLFKKFLQIERFYPLNLLLRRWLAER